MPTSSSWACPRRRSRRPWASSSRCASPRGRGSVARQGPRAPARHAADGGARGGVRRSAGGLRGRSRSCAREVEAGAGLVCASHSEVLAHGVADAFSAAAWSARSPTIRWGWSWRGWPRTPPRWPWAPPRPRASTRRAWRRRTSSSRCSPWRCGAVVRRARSSGAPAPATSWPRPSLPAPATARPGSCWRRRAGRRDHRARGPGGGGPRDRPAPGRGNRAGRAAGAVVSALAHLIEGTLPLEEWVKMVRAEQPEPARFGRRLRARPGWWKDSPPGFANASRAGG